MDFNFKGRMCLVIGATSGIGLALAQEYTACSANLAIVGTSSKKLEQAMESLLGMGGSRISKQQSLWKDLPNRRKSLNSCYFSALTMPIT